MDIPTLIRALYRTRAEEAEWKKRDPLETFSNGLVTLGLVKKSEVEFRMAMFRINLIQPWNTVQQSAEPNPRTLYRCVCAIQIYRAGQMADKELA